MWDDNKLGAPWWLEGETRERKASDVPGKGDMATYLQWLRQWCWMNHSSLIIDVYQDLPSSL